MEESRKNKWGVSIGEAFGSDDLPLKVQQTGTAYYYGEDGQKATYDVTGREEGTLTVNGEVTYVTIGRDAYKICVEKGVDLYSGWSKRP